jgi:hypothetical protein
MGRASQFLNLAAGFSSHRPGRAMLFVVLPGQVLPAAELSEVYRHRVLEERLPASPYWKGEWAALGNGQDKSKYWPMTHLEQWVPILFATTYLASFIAIIAS